MSTLRIGVVKPDWGVAGGFERLLDQLLRHLAGHGHRVVERRFPALISPRPVWGVGAGQRHWKQHPEFFRYMALAADVRRIDLDEYDLVITTQPPTFLADHDRVLALFYHQARIFYDLAEGFPALGEVAPAHHHAAVDIVRRTDAAHVESVRHWLAGSQECANRLDEYWGVTDNVSLLEAPPLSAGPGEPPPWDPAGPVLCVSRHEWPKRTELVVAAAQLLDDRPVVLAGGGGRIRYVRSLDAALTRDPGRARADDSTELWMQSALDVEAPSSSAPSTTQILGTVSDDDRNRLYGTASVVVAPAYREDYGLTALEAMQWGRPLIVCSDGGGLVDIVEDTGAGIIVEPTPSAIAEGVQRLVDDPDLVAELRARSCDAMATYTWERAHRQLDEAVSATLAR